MGRKDLSWRILWEHMVGVIYRHADNGYVGFNQ